MEGFEFKEETDCKAISTQVDVRYFWGKLIAFGHVSDISKKCMCIKAKYCFPVNSNIELFSPVKNEIVAIQATVRNYKQVNFRNNIICVEVLNPLQKYFDFIESLNPSSSVSR